MTSKSPTPDLVDEALTALFDTAMYYGPGFVNHGPMAVEALDHMGVGNEIPSFLDDYAVRLEDRPSSDEAVGAPSDIAEFITERAADLASTAAALAGHGLLRLAHAVRAFERSDSEVRRRDVAEAAAYWSAGEGIDTPRAAGHDALSAVVDALPRRAPLEAFLISDALETVAADEQVRTVIERLAPVDDHMATLNELALVAAERYLANGDARSFVFIHGVTVPTMAATLLEYLDNAGRDTLVHAVTGFVLLAIVAYDDPNADEPRPQRAGVPSELARAAAATFDDHSIKFTDACSVLAERTGSELPLIAATVRCAATKR